MSCDDTSNFLSLLGRLESAQLERAQTRGIAIRRFTFDLSSSVAAPYNGRGYGVVVPAFGQPSGVLLDLTLDGVPFVALPGSVIKTPFQRMEVGRNSAGIGTGTAVLYILDLPSAAVELGQLGVGALDAKNYTAAQSSTANIPSASTDGVSLNNARGARAIIAAPSGQTITAGTGVWWVYNDVSGRWAESSVQVALPTGRRDVALPDEFVNVSRGRAFLEIRSATASGAGALTVDLFAN